MDQISLSLICADPLGLKNDLEILEALGLKKIHLDIMDASFVPRFGLYPEIVRECEEGFNFEYDAHFMVENVSRGIVEWLKYHVPSKISFHYSGNKFCANDLIAEIRSAGSKAILAYDLTIPDEEFISSISKLDPDGVMLLGIVPGVLAQEHQPESVARRLKLLRSLDLPKLEIIQVDGGVNFNTMGMFIEYGATELVCGSSTVYKNVRRDAERANMITMNVKKIKDIIDGDVCT